MDNKDNKTEKKAKEKLEKISQKQALKDEKKLIKDNKKKQIEDLYKQLDGDRGLTKEEKIKKAKEKKIKKEKEKVNYKLAIKEMPVKMLKEINKIKWSDRKNLGQKFTWVIVFLIIFGMFFYAVDLGLQYLFDLLKIVDLTG